MPTERWRRIEALFHRAVDQPAALRTEFLDQECGADAALRLEVERLLQADAAGDDAFTRFEAHTHAAAADPMLARTLGPYRLSARLAEGGMGVVYRGERVDGLFQQEVAIKLIRAGQTSAWLRQRFEFERRTLAALQHPAIARLYDGGTTDDGQPYLVMELVRGLPIDRYCAREKLPLAARLRMFVHVCRAVQFAHQRLVVHCDLKPANILIDDAGQPHLLDFGIARLLGDASGREPGDEAALTPGYASPEQQVGGPVTTALDVYALGVILHELCTQSRPDGVAVQARRPLRGDLDCIVRKARHAEPAGRYASVQDFADDLERQLTGHPVRARAGSLAYRTAKFVRRNRVVVAVCAAAFAALWYGWLSARRGERLAHAEAEHAHMESDSFQSVADFLMDAFLPAQPTQDTAWQQRARDRILAHAARVERQYADSTHVRANLLDMLGQVCMRLDLYDDADRLVQQAMQLRATTFGTESLEYALSLRSAGQLKFQTGDYAAAERLLARALPLHRAAPTHPHADIAAVANDLAACLRNLGRDAEAEALHREALALRRQNGMASLPVAESLNNLAAVHLQHGDHATAIRDLRQALSIRTSILGEGHPLTLQTTANVAIALWRQGERTEALMLMRRAEAGYRALGSDGEDELGQTLASLATMQLETQDLDAAATSLDQALALQTKRLGDQHPLVAVTLSRLAVLQHARQRDEAARKIWQDVVRIRRAPEAPARDLAEALYGYGVFLFDVRDLDDAARHLEEALALHDAGRVDDALARARVEYVLGRCHLRRRDATRARTHLTEALRLFDTLPNAPESERARVRDVLNELDR